MLKVKAQYLTYRYRVRDGSSATRLALRRQASSVNYVWNYCCHIQREAEKRWNAGCSREASHWPTYFDLTRLTAGCTVDLGIHADTVAGVCKEFIKARDAGRGHPHWRSARRNLDWIPISHGDKAVRLQLGRVTFRKRYYYLWWSRDLPADAKVRTGSFACDSRGRWYFNVTFETAEKQAHGDGAIGIDLGLKSLATCSDGTTFPALQHYRQHEAALAVAQRAGNKRRVSAIHAKIANCRRDNLHKISTQLMRTNQRIVVGNVSASKLAKTKMAKSVLDVGWSSFRSMLAYKAIAHQVEYAEVNEAFSSRMCSACGTVPSSSPKGMGALGVRQWNCDDCGASHDRDVNAARNILNVGLAHQPQADGIAALAKVRSVTRSKFARDNSNTAGQA